MVEGADLQSNRNKVSTYHSACAISRKYHG